MYENVKILDCTLRDGGYYNSWSFSPKLVEEYLEAMDDLNIDFVEIGFRTLHNNSFKGPFAFTTDDFLGKLNIPDGLSEKIGIMINGSEIADTQTQISTLKQLFNNKSESPVTLVRIACHLNDIMSCLPATIWLKEQGYIVGINLMQIADHSLDEIQKLSKEVRKYPIDVFYFADSMGSLDPQYTTKIVERIKEEWQGEIGIHAHDNMGKAIDNSIKAVQNGTKWVDCTVTGMGRGPGNAQIEYLTISLEPYKSNMGNPTKLFTLIRKYFKTMKSAFGWGTNPYYYLAGKYGIHPSYIQEMLQDLRYSDEDIIAVIEYLKTKGGKKFSLDVLESARHFYSKDVKGVWKPALDLEDKSLLIIGAGPSIKEHQEAIESYIKKYKPYVIALNTEQSISEYLIDARAACHPIRLLSDCQEHLKLPKPLITPYSMLPKDIRTKLKGKRILDFGLTVLPNSFAFKETYCVIPNSLVISYVLAMGKSANLNTIKLVGFDGFSADDARAAEMEYVFKMYEENNGIPLCSLTPTRYKIPTKSIYGL